MRDAGDVVLLRLEGLAVHLHGQRTVEREPKRARLVELQLLEAGVPGVLGQKEQEHRAQRAQGRTGNAEVEQAVVGARLRADAEAPATGTGPAFAKRDALRRIDELREVHPLSAREAERLASCLNDKDLVAAALVVLDESDFDWCACCDASTVSALCAALYQSTSVHESVILEDAYAHLIHSRLDLSASLRACNPEAYLMRTMYAPIDPRSAAFIDLSEKGNVA